MESYVHDRVKQLTSHLSFLSKKLKLEILEENKTRAKQHTIDIMLLVKEAYYQNREDAANLETALELLDIYLERLQKATTVEAVTTVIQKITSLFADNKYKRELQCWHRCRRFRDIVDDWHESTTIKQLITNERTLNLLSFDAPTEMLKSKRIADDTIHTYGVCIDTSRYPEDLVNNVAHGIGSNSNISNNVFDIVMVMPNTTSLYDPIGLMQNIIPKQEYLTLSNCLRYLRVEGLLSLVLPYTRLDTELCTYLAKALDNIQLTRVNDILIEINGIKKAEKVLNTASYDTLREICFTFDDLPYETPTQYELPQQQLAITHFKGSIITDEMLADIQAKSNALNEIIEQGSFIDDLTNHKPLLPFNTGQIGLVLASGCLDGVVQEDEEHCHLIKGKIERKTVEAKNGDITVYHNVLINALTPDGKLIQIS